METLTKPLFSTRDLTRLIWPLIVEQALAITVGLSDSLMVAQVGEAAMSAVWSGKVSTDSSGRAVSS